jgi:hypothetical protein
MLKKMRKREEKAAKDLKKEGWHNPNIRKDLSSKREMAIWYTERTEQGSHLKFWNEASRGHLVEAYKHRGLDHEGTKQELIEQVCILTSLQQNQGTVGSGHFDRRLEAKAVEVRKVNWKFKNKQKEAIL